MKAKTAEQQMKAALDGNFWFFTSDGKIECRKVGVDHAPVHTVSQFRRAQVKKIHLPSSPAKPSRWSAQDREWLKANYKKKTIKQCATQLKKPYSAVCKRITALRWEELDGK